MFLSRKLNRETGLVEVWACAWASRDGGVPRKEFIRKIGDEGEVEFDPQALGIADAVLWAPGQTMGNGPVSCGEVFGAIKGTASDGAVLPCQIIPCGKFRNGAQRWFCKTHLTHWGTMADRAAVPESGEIQCRNHLMPMSFVAEPLEIGFRDFEETGIWCLLPPGLSSRPIPRHAPKLHVRKRFAAEDQAALGQELDAVVCALPPDSALLPNASLTKIPVTPPAAFEFVRALEEGRQLGCIACKKCGHPHLDLGDFAVRPHAKHFCGNCGSDSVWSPQPLVSTPLKPLHDRFNRSRDFVTPSRSLNLDDYAGLPFDLWASTPAIVWTANRPQEKGIHARVYDGSRRIVDATFSTVTYQGRPVSRQDLWHALVANTVC